MKLAFKTGALSALIACNLVALSGCVPLIPLVMGGGVVVGTQVATDRRTSGTQLEDEGIEIRASNRIRDSLGSRAHVNVTSYNRQVLLTGEVPNAQDKQLVEQIVSRVDNVRNVVNELAVLGNSTFSQRSSDTLVTGRARAALVDDKDLVASAFKIVTERGTVYMLGRVTKREADRATELVRGVTGAHKVVRMLEIISEDELARMLPQAPPSGQTPRSDP